MKTPYISSFFYFLLATALIPLSSLNVNAKEEPGDNGSTENQGIDKPVPEKEDDCSKKDSGKSRMSLSSSFATISGGFSILAPDQATPSFVGLRASNVGAPVESKTRSASPVLNFPGGISAFYATPQSLTPFGKGSEVLLSEMGWVRQVRSATGFLNVEEISNGYVITGYNVADIPAVKNAEGFYNIPTGLTPLSKRTVTAMNGGNKIKIEETTWYGKAPRTETVLMEQTPGKTNGTALLTQTWSNHNGVYKVAKTELTLPSSTLKARSAVPAPPVESYTNVVEEMGTDGVMYVVKRTAGTRTTYRWDKGPVSLSECNAVDESGNPLPESTTTTYTYYTDSSDRSSYGRPSTMRKTDGYWENYEYSDNNMGGIRTVKTLSPWMNTPAPALGEQPTGAHRVKQEVILKTDTGTSGLTVTVNGVPIEKYWTDSVNSGENTVIDTKHQPHSGGDKITVTKRYCRDKTKVDEALMGKPLLIKNADGSLEVYTYQIEGNTLITTCDSGYGTESSVSKGIRTISKTDKTTKKLKEEIRYAIQDGVAYWLSSKTGVDFDPVGNCLKWIYDNNPEDYSEERRDCCQVNWKRDRDGVETTYTRNASGDLLSETSRGKIKIHERKGLTTTMRRQEVGKGESYLVSEETLNMAGHVITKKVPTVGGNLLTTSYTYNTNERITTKTTPFGTTEQEILYIDKQLASSQTTTGLISIYVYEPMRNNGGGIITTRKENGITQIMEEDLLAKNIRKTVGNGAATLNIFNSAGIQIKSVLPDGEVMLYKDEQGVMSKGLDNDGDGILNPAVDSISKNETVFDASWPEGKGSWRTTQLMAWQGNWKETSISWQTEDNTLLRKKTPGLSGYSMQEQPPLSKKGTSYAIMIITEDGQRYETSCVVNNGNVSSTITTWKDANEKNITSLEIVQDVWGNTQTMTEARTGTTVYTNDEFTGTPLKVITPDDLITEYQYDNLGRQIATILPDGTKQNTDYDQESRVIRQWGSQQYPVSYEYDEKGRKTGMITYRAIVDKQANWPESSKGDRTTWAYDASTGNLLQKKYANSKGLTYTYTPGGKIKTRTNARGNTTTYSYDGVGQLISSVVNDNLTPAQNYTYDQWGRQISVTTEGVSSYQYTYNDQNQVLQEDVALSGENGVLNRQIMRNYDQYGRRESYELKQGDVVEQSFAYQYNGSLLSAIIADGKEFHYDYVPSAPHLLGKITSPVHVVINNYESQRDQLLNKSNSWKNKASNPIISGYAYTVNSLGQRTAVSTTGEVFTATTANWRWEYDPLGQVISANKNSYTYDQIGNRKKSQIGEGVESIYTVNALNQYTAINTTAPSHDEDGNLLTGLSATSSLPERNQLIFFYDANNRPVRVEQNNAIKENYAYDNKGRRVKKGNTVIVYDGYNAIAEYENGTLKSTYAWGIDMGGDIDQKAGGVGGLLSVTDYKTQISTISYPTYDGNGNISEYLIEGNQGIVSAHYEYDAFGTLIRKTGDKDYVYQFSTKPYDEKTGLFYYNYRSYDSESGKWMSRDFIEEIGGINLYGFLSNSPINSVDKLGNNPITGAIVAALWAVIEAGTGYKLNHCSKDNDLTTNKGVSECKSCVKTWGNIAHAVNLASNAVGMFVCTTITAGWGVFVCGTLTATATTITLNNIDDSMESEMKNCKCQES